jgi:hypothetical protein
MFVQKWLYRLILGFVTLTVVMGAIGCGKEQAAAPTTKPTEPEKFNTVGKSIGSTTGS